MGRQYHINRGEITAVAVIVALGAFVAWESTSYSFGTIVRVGPGLFPMALAVILIGLGIAILVEVFRSDTAIPSIPLRPAFFVVAGMVSWALLIGPLGLVPATLVLVVLGSLADRNSRPLTVAVLALVLSLMGVAVFIHLLGVPVSSFGR